MTGNVSGMSTSIDKGCFQARATWLEVTMMEKQFAVASVLEAFFMKESRQNPGIIRMCTTCRGNV